MNKSGQYIKPEWSKNLENLKTIYENEIKKHKKPITNQQIIKKLNAQFIKADSVLLAEFLQNHSHPKKLLNQSSFSQVESFFDLLSKNYQLTEAKYLKNSLLDSQQINQNVETIQKTFQKNKQTLSRFIKDQNQFFQQYLNKNLHPIQQNSESLGIQCHKVVHFLKSLLQNNDHIKLFQNGQNYFSQDNLSEKIDKLVNKYAEQIKQMPLKDIQLQQFFISEEQILDFLTFWLQSETQSSSFFIIYARTQAMLSKLERHYKQSIASKQVQNQIKDKTQIKQESQKLSNSKLIQQSQQVSSDNKSNEKQQILNKVISGENYHGNFILDRYRQAKVQDSFQKQKPKIKILSKQDRLQKIIPTFFIQACKASSKMLKGKTFDEIQGQLKFMNIQKFMNFCTDLKIIQLISRQFLIEIFKVNAINRLTLDLNRFSILLKKLIYKNSQVLDLLLRNEKFLKNSMNKKKLRTVLTDRDNSLSKYNYKLRPINGRNVEAIQQELKEKRELKQMIKKQKQSSNLKNKQTFLSKFNPPIEKKLTIQKSTISESKLTFLNPNQTSHYIKRTYAKNYSQRFNPQSLISNIDSEDKYWDEYESKIWKKQNDRNTLIANEVDRKSTLNESILESALSKRIQRGNKVLKKISTNSSNLKYYL